jgi:uncharacterized protein
MRAIVYAILFLVLYQAVKIVIRSALSSSGSDSGTERPSGSRLPGAEMVQDPQCRTYVVKDRAVTRRINGSTAFFCSDACADAYVRSRRS